MAQFNLDIGLEAQIAEAKQAGEIANATEPRAVGADYDPKTGLVNIRLKSGAIYSSPA